MDLENPNKFASPPQIIPTSTHSILQAIAEQLQREYEYSCNIYIKTL